MPRVSSNKKTNVAVCETVPEVTAPLRTASCVPEVSAPLRTASCAPVCAPVCETVPEVTSCSFESATMGCVKWFNNKAGYGFITVTDSATSEQRDIFVHHTAIQVGQAQFKYLVQGEYVELKISRVDNEQHEIQVSEVRGLKGGRLMCETRNEMRSVRDEHQQQTQVARTPYRSQAQSPVRTRDSRPAQKTRDSRPAQPQLSKNDEIEWMIVPRRKTSQTTGGGSGRPRPQQRQPTVELS